MAVAFDAVGAGGVATILSSTASQNHVIAATGADVVVLAGVAIGRSQTPGMGSWTRTCTYDGVGMTSLGIQTTGSGTGGGIEWWYRFNPPVGTKSVVAGVTGTSGTTGQMILATVSYTGVESIGTPVKTFDTNGAASVTVNPTTAGNRVVALIGQADPCVSPTQTQRYVNNYTTTGTCGNMLIQDAAGGGSVTLAVATAPDWWAAMGIELIAPAVVVTPPPSDAEQFFVMF